MLVPERYQEIGRVVKAWQLKEELCENIPINVALDMLVDLAAEVDRLRQPAQGPGGKGHLKPVILDAQGNAVAPPPIAHQLQHERRAQYDMDRLEAVMAIPDLTLWRVFSLRWGLSPPPGGWGNREIQLRVVHAVRLGIKDVPLFEKTVSASYLTGMGVKLPPGVTLKDGVLEGVELPD